MWIPDSAADIESIATAGGLTETATFEAKQSLPIPSRTIDVAVDVAAMSTDGGVLLYGIGEDRTKRLTILNPIPLAGARERIDNIVRTSLAEPPFIDIRAYPTEADPAVGYLLVIVPQSARAPHQVIVGGDLRFYGRGATGNRILTEGEIARLYERRQHWEQDRDELLRVAVTKSRFADQAGSVFAFARPVLPDRAIWERATAAAGNRTALRNELKAAASILHTKVEYDPSFRRAITDWHQIGADELRLSTLQEHEDPAAGAAHGLEATLHLDGSAEFYSARAVIESTMNMPSRMLVMEFLIAGNVASFLSLLSKLYELAGYYGYVDIGVAVTGLAGSSSYVTASRPSPPRYRAADFRRTERLAAIELDDPRIVVKRLLHPLLELTTGDEQFDPFAWEQV